MADNHPPHAVSAVETEEATVLIVWAEIRQPIVGGEVGEVSGACVACPCEHCAGKGLTQI